MMRYIESGETNPYYNLALEQHVFDSLPREHEYVMLWRNDNAIIVGKHQNTAGEINPAYVKEKGIRVARRLSGGGAVYHDLGNVNYTFIVNSRGLDSFDFASFCRPVARALAELGVAAEINGRNDMTIEGRKFSGNAQYCKSGRILHHGTILYDSDLSVVGEALKPPKDKIESKGLASVQSRITNVKRHMREDVPVERFMDILRAFMFRENSLVPYVLTPEDRAAIKKLQKETYETWRWNFGASPAYAIRKERRIEGCGAIEVFMNVRRGEITEIAFFGDYFGNRDTAELAALLTGRRMEEADLAAAVRGVNLGEYMHNLDEQTFLAILTG